MIIILNLMFYKANTKEMITDFKNSTDYGDSKKSVSVHGCLSHMPLCGPVMDWRPIQGVACLLPNGSWDRLQSPCDPELDLTGMENRRMDG